MKYSDLFCLGWYCWHDHGCKSKFTKQIHKEDGDSQFSKANDKMKLIQIVRKVFLCYIVEHFSL